ncbi:hypothetical protein Kpol_1028p59 [Vanderwaltozyma polyspora DSM 70294]|uniref:54S ribosomal protein IMG1, mitochondrial n=1 Tax=Vanderwaltozyma polyspora (strain ATCC 22028 / DSM 70294 / BCRC 21397 / CBS 2163 / NBRC 10782 / NRRL Y-8283 / UCD 57-17) TaxID=436907 RepID=A7TG27_VANPO|nr:uncharacterized protein Kpol_1028p59 [Vanderwaltozyma polyspora DSM 70294]EDO18784.1 hypothetical protein Kpol_1028p59 [Vanderwaltozyma polyspora DSM 70294]
MFKYGSFAGLFTRFGGIQAKRLYQIPVKPGKKIIPVYPAAEPNIERKLVCERLSQQDIEDKLDVTKWRRRMLGRYPPAPNEVSLKIKSGDIVRVVYDSNKSDNDSFVGYVLGVDRKRLIQDSSLLLRNQISKTFVELRVPMFSPLIERIDILKRTDDVPNKRKRRRNKHYYIRGTKLDVGDLEAMLRKRR